MNIIIPFEYLSGHVVAVAASVNGLPDSKFILDTGAGINLLTKHFSHAINVKPTGSYSGKRMSGQTVAIPTAILSSLKVGAVELKNVEVGVFDGLPSQMDVKGIISLKSLEAFAFTYDYQKQNILFENADSLAERVLKGVVVPVRVERDSLSIAVFLRLVLPDQSIAEVEVDTGSGSLVLADKYRSELAVSGGKRSLKSIEGVDETGHHFVRHFGTLDGEVSLFGAPTILQKRPPVMFQKIIYDGLVGDAFLRQFKVTYDLPNSRLIFGRY